MSEEEIYELKREVEDLKMIIYSLKKHLGYIPRWFYYNAYHETRTGVDSWDMWKFHPWVLEHIKLANGEGLR